MKHHEPKTLTPIQHMPHGENEELDEFSFHLHTTNQATRLMAKSLGTVFQAVIKDTDEGETTFICRTKQAAEALRASISRLEEFDPPLAELEVPPVDARLEGMVNEISHLATKFSTADGVMILELALLKILDLPKGAVYYDPDPEAGTQIHAVSAWQVAGMNHLMGLHWSNQRTLINLRSALDEEF